MQSLVQYRCFRLKKYRSVVQVDLDALILVKLNLLIDEGTLEEICRNYFEEKYDCKEMISWLEKNQHITWTDLHSIYCDFVKRKSCLEKAQEFLITFLNNMKKQTKHIHFISTRIKDEEHLLYKIIRKLSAIQQKYQDINVQNYYKIITDFVGGRILLKYAKDWKEIDEFIRSNAIDKKQNYIRFDQKPDYNFRDLDKSSVYIVEEPILFMRFGSADFTSHKIKSKLSYRGYRSIHYVVKIYGVYCEIQLRTMADEIYAEFSHDVCYPDNEKNVFLNRYTDHISKLTNEIDDMLSMYWYLPEDAVNVCKTHYAESDLEYPVIVEKSELESKSRETKQESREFSQIDSVVNPSDRINSRIKTGL
jgi:putative GTP pyrophosphokinase